MPFSIGGPLYPCVYIAPLRYRKVFGMHVWDSVQELGMRFTVNFKTG